MIVHSNYATPADFEWPSKLDRAITAGYDPGEDYGSQPVDTTAPLSPRIVKWIHQGSADGCGQCGVRCIDCDDRMCDRWGPAPVVRCPDHPTCEDCDDVVTCPECCLLLADAAQDREDERLYEIHRDERGA